MNKFKIYAQIFLAILGVAAFSKNEADVLALTDDQKNTLVTEGGYEASFIDQFNAALAKDFKDDDTLSAPAATASASTVTAPDMQTLKDTALALSKAQAQLDTMNASNSTLASEKANLEGTIASLNAQIQTLTKEPERDNGAGALNATQAMTVDFDPMDDKQLGGIKGAMWSLDRPYNQRARAAILATQGMQVVVPTATSTDFAALQEDLGAYYRQQKNKEINSMLLALPTVTDIFPLESNTVDREIITNLFMGEFSQADNSESDFEKVVKGKYDIQSEEVRMYDVMLAHQFKNLKRMEKSWIGYLAKDSSSIKISFVEYLLRETAKVLHNEQQQRRIRGVRKNPTVDAPGESMAGSTGLYRYIHEKINNLQIKPTVVGDITEGNIGAKVYQFIKSIPQQLIDSGMMAVYMPTAMVTEYDKYNELNYGTNQDYKANIRYVKEYPSVKIIPTPNAGNHRRLICTFEGNLKCFENVPGEMTNFKLIIKEWSISVVSQWKEGFGAPLVGKKWTRAQDMDYNHQFIFCTDSDLSASEFLPMEQDVTTPSALFHNSLVSVANTALKTITDITDVATGAKVTLKNGSDAYGIKIANTGNFSLLATAWEPAVGDTITLVKRADGKFIEFSRGTAAASVLAFAADDATPSVAGATEFVTNANTQATAITGLDNAVTGNTYTIHGAGSTYASTIANAGNFSLTAAMTLSAGKSITLIALGDGKFAEISRV